MNKAELEKIQRSEVLIKETAEWWHKEMTQRTDEYEKLLSKPDSNYDEVQAVRKQILALQRKAAEEQRFMEEHEKNKKKFLLKYMMSGCLGMDLNY